MYIKKDTFKVTNTDSFVYNENINTEDLNMHANRVEGYEEAMNIIKEYDNIIKTSKKKIILFASQQGNVFRKFKENRRFKSFVE